MRYKWYICPVLIRLSIYKQLGIFLLLIVLLVQSFNKAIIMGDYYLNTATYAINCENKAKIELHCNGQCVMAKKLKEAEEKEKKNPDRKAESQSDFYIFRQNVYIALFHAFYDDRQKEFPVLADPTTIDRPHFVFRPPIA